jgi:hypothetical protein
LEGLKGKRFQGHEQLVSVVLVDPLQGNSGVQERLLLPSLPHLRRPIFFVLHGVVNGIGEVTKFLCLMQAGGAYEIAMEEYSKVADSVFEVPE